MQAPSFFRDGLAPGTVWNVEVYRLAWPALSDTNITDVIVKGQFGNYSFNNGVTLPASGFVVLYDASVAVEQGQRRQELSQQEAAGSLYNW